ncbi:MAG: hypothetical protein ACRDT8_25910 [Micromonosporaceae bacterium]
MPALPARVCRRRLSTATCLVEASETQSYIWSLPEVSTGVLAASASAGSESPEQGSDGSFGSGLADADADGAGLAFDGDAGGSLGDALPEGVGHNASEPPEAALDRPAGDDGDGDGLAPSAPEDAPVELLGFGVGESDGSGFAAVLLSLGRGEPVLPELG